MNKIVTFRKSAIQSCPLSIRSRTAPGVYFLRISMASSDFSLLIEEENDLGNVDLVHYSYNNILFYF